MTTATRTEHCKTDRSNALCHCRLGAHHGNATALAQKSVLTVLLRGYDYTFAELRGDILIVPAAATDTAKIRATLLRFNVEPQYRSSTDQGGRGLLVVAETWVR